MSDSNKCIKDINKWSFKSPKDWGKTYPKCNGKNQSPINIDTDFLQNCSIGCTLNFAYMKSKYQYCNNGKYVKVKVDNGSHVFWNDQSYSLSSIFIHWPSLHRINGNKYDMELNFLHISDDPVKANKLFISVFVNKAETPLESSNILKTFADLINYSGGNIGQLADSTKKYNLNDLLPDSKNFFTYTGSFPFPPCNEEIDWIIMENPISISSSAFRVFNKMNLKPNVRPQQPLNNRIVFYNNDLEKSGKKFNKKKTIIQCRKSSKPLPSNNCNRNISKERKTLNSVSGGNVSDSTWNTLSLIFKWIILISFLLVVIKITFVVLKLLWTDGILARFDLKLILTGKSFFNFVNKSISN